MTLPRGREGVVPGEGGGLSEKIDSTRSDCVVKPWPATCISLWVGGGGWEEEKSPNSDTLKN